MSCPGYRVRYRNFVETMAPCLKSGVLQAILADFEGSMSGFGLDYVWCRLSRDNRFKAAILDDVAVRHTRPVGQTLRNAMEERGLSPEDEERRLFARYSLKDKTGPLVYAAIIGASGGASAQFGSAWRWRPPISASWRNFRRSRARAENHATCSAADHPPNRFVATAKTQIRVNIPEMSSCAVDA